MHEDSSSSNPPEFVCVDDLPANIQVSGNSLASSSGNHEVFPNDRDDEAQVMHEDHKIAPEYENVTENSANVQDNELTIDREIHRDVSRSENSDIPEDSVEEIEGSSDNIQIPNVAPRIEEVADNDVLNEGAVNDNSNSNVAAAPEGDQNDEETGHSGGN